MTPIRIDDPADARVAEFRRLNDRAFRRDVEAAGPFHRGLFVVEGWLAIERLLPSRYATRGLLVDEAKLDRAVELVGRRSVPILMAPAGVVDEIVGFPLHRGVVASAERGVPRLPSEVAGRARHLVVAEGVNDAENLGSIIRNAVALGADGLLLDPTSCDPLARRTVRVSVGHALSLPTARTGAGWPGELRAAGFRTVALTPRAGAVPVDEVEVDGADRVALVVGAEGPGLADATIDACDLAVRIPMARGVDSLNVATALAVAAHRLFRLD